MSTQSGQGGQTLLLKLVDLDTVQVGRDSHDDTIVVTRGVPDHEQSDPHVIDTSDILKLAGEYGYSVENVQANLGSNQVYVYLVPGGD